MQVEAALQVAQLEVRRPPAPGRLQLRLAGTAAQLAAVIEVLHQPAQVLAAHLRGQFGSGAARAAEPAAGDVDFLVRRAETQRVHVQAVGQRPRAQHGLAQHHLAELQVGDVQRERRQLGRVHVIGAGLYPRRRGRRTRCRRQ